MQTFKVLNLTVNGFIGIGTDYPNESLTVVGNTSASGVIYANGGNSNLWNVGGYMPISITTNQVGGLSAGTHFTTNTSLSYLLQQLLQNSLQ